MQWLVVDNFVDRCFWRRFLLCGLTRSCIGDAMLVCASFGTNLFLHVYSVYCSRHML